MKHYGMMGMYDAVLNTVKDRPKTEREIREVLCIAPNEESLFTAILSGLQREYRIIYNTATEEYSYNPNVARTI